MMQKLTLLLVCLSLANGNPAAGKPWHWKSRMPLLSADGSFKPSGRIVGGTEAVPHSWPHQVGIFIDDMYFCGGSLISDEWVLTAAHCTDGSKNFEVVMGAHNIKANEATQVSMTTTNFLVHENYDYDTLDNDISLIKLPQPVKLIDEDIQTVKLPTENVNVGDTVTLTGWGSTTDSSSVMVDKLRQIDRQIISKKDCADVYGSMIDDDIICTSAEDGHGICHGDSGGPMNKDKKIYGITSFAADVGCDSGYPHGFTNVFRYLDWIEEKTGVTPQ